MKCSKDAFWKCLKRYISKTIIVLTILFLFILLQISGGKEMMAMLWAQQIRSVYKELHADHETGAADNK